MNTKILNKGNRIMNFITLLERKKEALERTGIKISCENDNETGNVCICSEDWRELKIIGIDRKEISEYVKLLLIIKIDKAIKGKEKEFEKLSN